MIPYGTPLHAATYGEQARAITDGSTGKLLVDRLSRTGQ
jgi:hypothetical protein